MTKHIDRQKSSLFTIGHSTRSFDEFIDILKAQGIKEVVDIRTIPRSRHNPQFNEETLKENLKAAHIGYLHMKGLGGLRHPRKDSPNKAWRNASFRGFADYMQTEEFAENLKALMETAAIKPTAIMCAEAVPWRCHRSLIADALLVRGIQVIHVMSRDSARPHTLTPWAEVRDGRITYPEEGSKEEDS